jgi:hypothetical protein
MSNKSALWGIIGITLALIVFYFFEYNGFYGFFIGVLFGMFRMATYYINDKKKDSILSNIDSDIKINNIKKTKLPKYVTLNGIALILNGKKYTRHAGAWAVGIKEMNGKLFSNSIDTPSINNIELIKTTKKNWEENNWPYIYGEDKDIHGNICKNKRKIK